MPALHGQAECRVSAADGSPEAKEPQSLGHFEPRALFPSGSRWHLISWHQGGTVLFLGSEAFLRLEKGARRSGCGRGRITYSWWIKWPPEALLDMARLRIVSGLSLRILSAQASASIVPEQQVSQAGKILSRPAPGSLCAAVCDTLSLRLLAKVTPCQHTVPGPLWRRAEGRPE